VCAAAACAARSSGGHSISDPVDTADGIAAIGRAGDLAYAVTWSGKLRAFNLRTFELRTLDRTSVIAIARDASVALSTSVSPAAPGAIIEAWEPASGRPIALRRFDDGLARAPRASRAKAVILWNPRPSDLDDPPVRPLPSTELLSWDLASGNVDLVDDECGDQLGLSVDGAIALCGLRWTDLRSGRRAPPPPLAPDWAPRVRSTWLSGDGKYIYVTYERTVGGQAWRLDRWTPDATGKTGGRIEQLVASQEPTADEVLAVSRDGRTLLTRAGNRPPVIRHAPGYEGVSLPAPRATAAAFSEDDRLIVTGHGDGGLRLWEARAGGLLAMRPE